VDCEIEVCQKYADGQLEKVRFNNNYYYLKSENKYENYQKTKLISPKQGAEFCAKPSIFFGVLPFDL
jgi:hypothetical protein